jgi:hypothetical protein
MSFAILGVAKEHHIWPDDAMEFIQTSDDEGKQYRKNLETPSYERKYYTSLIRSSMNSAHFADWLAKLNAVFNLVSLFSTGNTVH